MSKYNFSLRYKILNIFYIVIEQNLFIYIIFEAVSVKIKYIYWYNNIKLNKSIETSSSKLNKKNYIHIFFFVTVIPCLTCMEIAV